MNYQFNNQDKNGYPDMSFFFYKFYSIKSL